MPAIDHVRCCWQLGVDAAVKLGTPAAPNQSYPVGGSSGLWHVANLLSENPLPNPCDDPNAGGRPEIPKISVRNICFQFGMYQHSGLYSLICDIWDRKCWGILAQHKPRKELSDPLDQGQANAVDCPLRCVAITGACKCSGSNRGTAGRSA